MNGFAIGPSLSPASRAYAIAASAIAVELVFLAFYTGFVRVRNKAFVNPEDARAGKTEVAAAEHPDVERAKKAHVNAIENAVPFFAVGLVYAWSGASATGAYVLFGTFVAARFLHAIFYLGGMQPWRTIAFTVGALTILAIAFLALATIARKP